MKAFDEALIERVAQAIYCDSYTQYGTCTLARWQATSEEQRQFCRGQADAAIQVIKQVINNSNLFGVSTDESS